MDASSQCIQNRCPFCKGSTVFMVDGFPCRVCGVTFHLKCLKASGRYTDKELIFVDRAKTSIGWSCEECDNLCNLLTPDEMEQLSNKFDELDISQDSRVSLDEFLIYTAKVQKELWGEDLTDDDVRVAKQQFKLLDVDGSGEIEYMEYMKQEAVKMLVKRDESDLVELLTPLEKESARKKFEHFDKDKGGTIEESEIRTFYRNWYTTLDYYMDSSKYLEQKDASGMNKPVLESKAIGGHIDTQSNMIMDGDKDKSGSIDWDEYLRSQAIHMLSSRPNKVNIQQCF